MPKEPHVDLGARDTKQTNILWNSCVCVCVCARAYLMHLTVFYPTAQKQMLTRRCPLDAEVLEEQGGRPDPFSRLDSEPLPACGPMCVDRFTQRLGKLQY